jgi:hypothetical protein
LGVNRNRDLCGLGLERAVLLHVLHLGQVSRRSNLLKSFAMDEKKQTNQGVPKMNARLNIIPERKSA